MNTDVEDLLREGMERFTSDLRAPAGLTRQAAQRHRRRLALRSVAGTAAALTAGAVVLVVAVVPGTRRGGTEGPAAPAAYVVKRVDSALNAAEPGAIAQMTVTTSGTAIPGGKATTAEEWSYGNQWRSVTNSLAGHPLYDEGFRASRVYTLVSYLTQTWARRRGPAALAALGFPTALGFPAANVFRAATGFAAAKALVQTGSAAAKGRLPAGAPAAKGYPAAVSGPRGCWPMAAAVALPFRFGLPGIGSSASSLPATVARDLRTAVACGTLVVAGWRVRVNGIEAIELTSRRPSLIPETIWVNPATDLPFRVIIRSAPGRPVLRQTANISWLRPTAQNLAQLTVPVPPGFRRVSLAKAVRPILQQIPAQPQLARCFALPAPACAYGPGALGYGPGPGHAGRLRLLIPRSPAPKSS